MPGILIFTRAFIERLVFTPERASLKATLSGDLFIQRDPFERRIPNLQLPIYWDPDGVEPTAQTLEIDVGNELALVDQNALIKAARKYLHLFAFDPDQASPLAQIVIEDHRVFQPYGFRMRLVDEATPIRQPEVVRDTMNSVMQQLGAALLDEDFPDTSYRKADYYFPDEDVIVEFKCLEEDTYSDGAFPKKVRELYSEWVRKGLVRGPVPNRIVIDPDFLPGDAIRQVQSLIRRKLHSTILRSANSQIRHTAEHITKKPSKGLLLLAADGNHALPPNFVVQVIREACELPKGPDQSAPYSAINSIAYFNAREPVTIPGKLGPHGIFIAQGIRDREDVPQSLIKKIAEGWARQQGRAGKANFREGTFEELDGIQYR